MGSSNGRGRGCGPSYGATHCSEADSTYGGTLSCPAHAHIIGVALSWMHVGKVWLCVITTPPCDIPGCLQTLLVYARHLFNECGLIFHGLIKLGFLCPIIPHTRISFDYMYLECYNPGMSF